jgi:hypothetical protein
MKTFYLIAAIVLTVGLSSKAQAGLRDRCAAANGGARAGDAFTKCVAQGIRRGEGRESTPRLQQP